MGKAHSVMWESPVQGGEERSKKTPALQIQTQKVDAFSLSFFPYISYGKLVKCQDVELPLL